VLALCYQGPGTCFDTHSYGSAHSLHERVCPPLGYCPGNRACACLQNAVQESLLLKGGHTDIQKDLEQVCGRHGHDSNGTQATKRGFFLCRGCLQHLLKVMGSPGESSNTLLAEGARNVAVRNRNNKSVTSRRTLFMLPTCCQAMPSCTPVACFISICPCTAIERPRDPSRRTAHAPMP